MRASIRHAGSWVITKKGDIETSGDGERADTAGQG